MAHIKQFKHLKIPLEAIISATNNFSDESFIGKGGFGKVYKGEIAHFEGHTKVAVKRLDPRFGQGDPEFWMEITILSLYKHENIVSLLGYCDDFHEKILVYEYASKRSLEQYLKSSELTWIGRLNICIGAARGLAYLHSAPMGTPKRLLHCDIKSSNILLDENWNGKISDFGLSQFGPANQEYSFLVSHPVGTPGYVDPLYAEKNSLTKESDVYSFGVVLFEVLCGRLSLSDKSNELQPLVELVQNEKHKLNEIIYGNIKDEINPDSLKAYTTIAYQCLKRDREERPLMSEIVTALETALQSQVFIKDEVANISSLPKSPEVYTLDHEKATNPMGIEENASESGGFLVVTIHEGNDLKAKHPFILLRIGHDIRRTTTMKNNKNPIWEETFKFTFDKPPTNARMYLVVSSSSRTDKYFNGNVFGDLYISLADVLREKQIDKVYQLQNGRIHVELQWEPSALPLKRKPKMLQFLSSVYNVGIKGVQGE